MHISFYTYINRMPFEKNSNTRLKQSLFLFMLSYDIRFFEELYCIIYHNIFILTFKEHTSQKIFKKRKVPFAKIHKILFESLRYIYSNGI